MGLQARRPPRQQELSCPRGPTPGGGRGRAAVVEAAVADTGPEANWFVTISGERGDDGHVSIDRIDSDPDSEEEGTSSYLRWCWPWGCGDDVLALGDD